MNPQTHSEDAVAVHLILEAIVTAGMRGAFLQDHEFVTLRDMANRMHGQDREKIIARLVEKLNEIQPYNPSKHSAR